MPRASTRSQTRLPPQQKQVGIQSFARASKPGIAPPDHDLKGKGAALPGLPASPSKKRKLNELAGVGEVGKGEGEGEETQQQEGGKEGEKDVTATPSKTLRFSDLSLSTPRSSRSGIRRSLTVTPTKTTQTTLTTKAKGVKRSIPPSRSLPTLSEDYSSSSAPPSTSTTAPSSEESTSTPQTSPPSTRSPTPTPTPPASFYDLLNLHLSFVKALSLHFAHNGAATPADLREFLPSVGRIWKKRKVVTKDLQRLIRVWDEEREQGEEGESTVPRFRIANYGLGKVCLEKVAVGQSASVSAGPLNENKLQERFERKLERVWRRVVDSSSTQKDGGNDRDDFVEKIALAPIHESYTPFTSLRKGQQRLQDLKGGVIRLKMAKFAAKSAEDDDSTAKKTPEATTDRRKGLLDRIKDKQLRQSKLPPPPSKEMLLRRSAAQRVEEVAGVLTMLRPSGSVGSGPWAIAAAQKKPYRFETIVQNVQDSVKNPISDKEVEICLEILAQKSVAGDWVDIVTVNQLRSIVLKSGRDASPKDIGARVTELNIGWEDCPSGEISA
ncbi:hypothetical protein VTN00DRAFT_1584 [Thermoascus crustaceus]|uniref:uncharacterized protein n=1 Tax=Thermoascus crustaceus TaxID=5088 RepID=UPI00374262AA